jgi:hypothetical protein
MTVVPAVTDTEHTPIWDDPPPPTTRWAATLNPLRNHPHRWARIAQHLTQRQARDRVRYLRQARGPLAADRTNWEIRAARLEQRTDTYAWAIWARYNPPTTGDTTP